jgi:deoxycytidylate deaminase
MSGLDTVYRERSNFIILGLTGRTGSGCTEIATLLEKEFAGFNPPKPKYSDFNNDEERKYRVVYGFTEENWKSYHHIRMSHVIATFLLELPFSKFVELYKSVSKITDEETDRINRLAERYNLFSDKRKVAKVNAESNKDLYNQIDYKFYFEELPKEIDYLKKVLDLIQPGSFTNFFQLIGNNIRKSGCADGTDYDFNKIYMFSQRANKFIKLLRNKSLTTKEHVFVVIDAIRNPYEALFFKERYPNFYLLSVTVDNKARFNRLLNQRGMSKEKIKRLDEKESPSKLPGENCFWSLDVARCIEISDIHLFNPDDGKKFKFVKGQLVKYLALIMHPGLITPSKDERCMQFAYNAKLNSGCISRQVGAVVTDPSGAVKAIGWNNVPQGQTPCNLRRVSDLLKNEDDKAFSRFEKEDEDFTDRMNLIYKDTNYSFSGKPVSFCFKDIKNSLDEEKNQVHTRALHAEENAFLQISKHGGVSIQDGILYTTASPCELCAKKAYQLGIKKIIYIDPYPGIANDHIILSGNKSPETNLFYGAIGRAYQQLFEPIMPYKNELNMGLNLKIPNQKKILKSENEDLKLKIEELESEVEQLKAKNKGVKK